MAMSQRKGLLKKKDMEVLLEDMRAVDGIVESWARVLVARK